MYVDDPANTKYDGRLMLHLPPELQVLPVEHLDCFTELPWLRVGRGTVRKIHARALRAEHEQ